MPGSGLRVEGLSQLRSALRRFEDAEGLVEVREGLRDAAGIVASDAQRRARQFSDEAADTIRPTVAGNRAYVKGGKARLTWYGWADFGSRRPRRGQPRSVGPWKNSGKGPRGGRFIYPAVEATRHRVAAAVERSLDRAIRRLRL